MYATPTRTARAKTGTTEATTNWNPAMPRRSPPPARPAWLHSPESSKVRIRDVNAPRCPFTNSSPGRCWHTMSAGANIAASPRPPDLSRARKDGCDPWP